MDDTDALRITLFYFTDRVLCARPFERRITKEIMHVVNYLDYFNNFSWGTYTWKILYKQMTKSLIGKVDKYKKEHIKDHIREKYNFSGFVYGVQAWIFELVGTITGKYRIQTKLKYSCILKWSLSSTLQYPDVAKIFNALTTKTKQVLNRTKTKSKKAYYQDVMTYKPLIPIWVVKTSSLMMTNPTATILQLMTQLEVFSLTMTHPMATTLQLTTQLEVGHLVMMVHSILSEKKKIIMIISFVKWRRSRLMLPK